MFGPITNTLLKVMKPNPSKYGETGWGRPSYGYYPKSRSSQGHIPGQISQKGENSKFFLFLLQLY